MPVQDGASDGYVSFDAGQNEGSIPALIGETQTHRNINVSLRNRSVRPRPPLIEFDLNFISEDVAKAKVAHGALTYKNNFYFGRIQFVGKYQTSHGEFLLKVVNGVIYLVDLIKHEIRVVEVEGSQKILNYNLTRINGTQTENEFVLFDWPGNPVVITSDFTARRSKSANQEIPRSYIGTHVHGRLFVGNTGTEFGASDLRLASQNGVITFKDSIVAVNNPSPPFPNQFFKLNYIDKLSAITAMGFLHQADGTSPLGFGPLFISTKEAIHLAAVNQPRTQWQQTQSFVRVVVYNYGIIGPKAFVNVGQDLFYKSFDGHIYTTSLMSADQLKWGITHISSEIKDSLISRNQHLLKYSTLSYFENRIFVTLKPYIVQALSLFSKPIEAYVSNGVGILELNNISGLSGNSTPVWAGIYTGAFIDMIEIGDKMVFLTKTNGRNAISQLVENRTLDYSRGINKKIRTRIYTKEFNFKIPLNEKKIKHVQLDVRNVLNIFIAHIFFRAKGDLEWQKFGSIYYTPKDLKERGSIINESVSAPADAVVTCHNIQFRIDIVGEEWELIRFTVLGEAYSDIMFERKFDKPFTLTEDFSVVEDLEL